MHSGTESAIYFGVRFIDRDPSWSDGPPIRDATSTGFNLTREGVRFRDSRSIRE